MINVKTFVVGPLETNCYVVFDGTKRGILIDPGFYDERIAQFIKNKGLDIRYIVNTHGHADHITANGMFGAPVLIHELDRDFLKDPVKNLSFMAGPGAAGLSPAPVTAKRALKDKDIIKVNGFSFEVIHTPGHTPGGICLKIGNILFTGDTLFREGVGRVDLPYSDPDALMRSIKERLLNFKDDMILYPGHGPGSTLGHEKKYNPFL